MPRLTLPFLLFLWLFCPLNSQQDPPDPQSANPPALKRGFSTLLLGDSVQATKDKLQQDRYFLYPGEPDISFDRQPQPQLAVKGSGYLKQAQLLFYQQKLYLIELQLNGQWISYQSLLAWLTERYLRPQQIDQRRVVWQNEGTRLTLSYPDVVQIVDLAALATMSEQKGEERQLLERNRNSFLEQF